MDFDPLKQVKELSDKYALPTPPVSNRYRQSREEATAKVRAFIEQLRTTHRVTLTPVTK